LKEQKRLSAWQEVKSKNEWPSLDQIDFQVLDAMEDEISEDDEEVKEIEGDQSVILSKEILRIISKEEEIDLLFHLAYEFFESCLQWRFSQLEFQLTVRLQETQRILDSENSNPKQRAQLDFETLISYGKSLFNHGEFRSGDFALQLFSKALEKVY
jgi:hypothetical protein